MPVAHVPADTAEPAAAVCSQCGAALTPGKRFCRQCGTPAALQPEPPLAAESAGGVPPAKLVDEPLKPPAAAAEAQWSDTVSFGPKAIPIPEWEPVGVSGQTPPVSTQAPVEPVLHVPVEPIPQEPVKFVPQAPVVSVPQMPIEPFAQAPVAPSPREPVEFVPLEPGKSVPREAVEFVPLEPVKSVPQEPIESVPAIPAPKRNPGLMIGIAAVVLMAAVGGWVWYSHVHRGAASVAKSSTATQQTVAQGGSSAAPGTTAQSAKPPAGTAALPAASAPVAASQPAPAPSQAPANQTQPPSSSRPGRGKPDEPSFALNKPLGTPVTPPPSPSQPAQERSGVRHYQGPPVPHGGLVVFDNLPSARLKFTFDHSAWQLILKTNPDGTKKAILISQAQGSQLSCDLGWELVK